MKMQRWRRFARQLYEINPSVIVTDTPTKL